MSAINLIFGLWPLFAIAVSPSFWSLDQLAAETLGVYLRLWRFVSETACQFFYILYKFYFQKVRNIGEIGLFGKKLTLEHLCFFIKNPQKWRISLQVPPCCRREHWNYLIWPAPAVKYPIMSQNYSNWKKSGNIENLHYRLEIITEFDI